MSFRVILRGAGGVSGGHFVQQSEVITVIVVEGEP